MRSVAWISDNGQTLVFNDNGPYYYGSLVYTQGATAEVSRVPRQDGQTTYHASLDVPGITFAGSVWIMGNRHVSALHEYDRHKSLIMQAFAPNRWGTLIYYTEDGAWQMRCRPINLPTFGKPIGSFATLEIDFTSDDYHWESAQEQVLSLGVNLKMFHFPWGASLAAMGAFNRFAKIHNDTTERIYPTLEVYTTGQYVTLTNLTTNRAVTINHAIADNQKLVVDLRDITATLWTKDQHGDFTIEEDVSNWMSLESDPWWIDPGDNRVSITNDVPEDTPLAFVRWRIPRVGV